ncbi:MAG: hypothetical protein FWG67_02830 [Defluviitaleaceae bacterium]|nr:hypothetical protein [Defluviitaleaceae bacterium]
MTYQLMYKDDVVIEFDPKSIESYDCVNEKLLPIGIQNGMNLESWLRQRRADKSRVSVRKLFATLKMNFGQDGYISQFRKPTDFWWIRKKGSDDVFDVPIEDLHLITLNLEAIVPKSPRTFEVANIGSYEKGWKENHLIKFGKVNELFSELLYANISTGYMPTAQYGVEKIKGHLFISSLNFIDQSVGEYLVLADEWTGTGSEEGFEGWFDQFKGQLSEAEVSALSIMHFLDVVMNNFDRHCQNFGFVYDEAGERRLAPNFDFNLSIIGYNSLKQLGENEMPLSTYFELFDDIPLAVKHVPDIKKLEQEIIKICHLLALDGHNYLPVAQWIVTRWKTLIGGIF